MVCVVNRIGDEHLVAVVEQREQRRMNTERGPCRDEDLGTGIVGDVILSGQLIGYGLTQHDLPAVVG